MTDEILKKLLQEDMQREAELIMQEVNSDPTLKDVKCPDSVREKLFEQIRLYEEKKAYEQLSDEDKELIRLGKIAKKKRKASRYAVLAAAMVALLALGTVSFGEKHSIFNTISRLFSKEEQVVINSDGIEPITYVDESEAYEKIEEEYGFTPVRLVYLPYNVEFIEAVFGNEMQGINIVYGQEAHANIVYIIRPNFRESSLGTHIEDKKLQEYERYVNDTKISLAEFLIEDSGENRWAIQFEYQNVQYLLRVTNIEQKEVENIINDLGFGN